MAGIKITELTQADAMSAEASFVITQLETVGSSQVESVRRAGMEATVTALKDAGVNDGCATDEDVSELKNVLDALFINMLEHAGEFSPSNTWFQASATGYAVSNNIAEFTATAPYGGIKKYTANTLKQGHVYYAFAKIKGSSNVIITFNGYGVGMQESSADEYKFASLVYERTDADTSTNPLMIMDRSTSGWGKVYAKEVGLIDLTETFGNNIPGKEYLDSIFKPLGFMMQYPVKIYLDYLSMQHVHDVDDIMDSITFCENLLGDGGKFSPSSTWYKMAGTDSYTVSDNVATYTITARFGGIKSLKKFTMTSGHKFYALAKINSSTPQTLSFDGTGSAKNNGTGSFEFISMIVEGTGLERALIISDGNESGPYGQVQVKDVGVVDLTDTFGDNVPSKADLDSLFSVIGFFNIYPIGKFVGWLNSEHALLSEEVAQTREKADQNAAKIGNFITNLLGNAGRFSPSTTWFTVNATQYTVSSNVASFKATAQYGGIKNYTAMAIPEGHKMYAFAMLKGNSNHRITFNASGSASASGTGDFEFVSLIETHSNSNAVNMWVVDASTSGFETCYVKNCGVIDLTETFGDILPTKDQLDAFVSSVGFFDTFPLGEFIRYFYSSFIALGAGGYANISSKTVAIIGDSITQTNVIDSSGNLTPNRTNWPTYAMPLLGNPTVYNFAQDGSSYHDFSGSDTYQTFTKQYNLMVSKGIDPDLIVVSLGTNDTQYAHTDTYESAMAVSTLEGLDKTNLYQAIRWAFWSLTENYPNATIVVGTPIQRADTPVFNFVREAIIKMAQTYCINIADAETESGIIKQFEKIPGGGAGRYLADGLHPNTEGKKLLGKYYAWGVTRYMLPAKN